MIFLQLLHSVIKNKDKINWHYDNEMHIGGHFKRVQGQVKQWVPPQTVITKAYPEGVSYYSKQKSHNRSRSVEIEVKTTTQAIFRVRFHEQHREDFFLEFKIGDPAFKMTNLAKVINVWLMWRITYQELSGKDTR